MGRLTRCAKVHVRFAIAIAESESRFIVHTRSRSGIHGFSLPELMIVVAIIFVTLTMGGLLVNTTIQMSQLRGSATRYAELLQTARTRAASDDRFYSVYIQPAAGPNTSLAYVDVYPQLVNGVSGHGPPPTGFYDPGHGVPVTTLSTSVLPQPVASAPATANLKNLFCAACAPNIVSNGAPTWGPDGMPCKANASLDLSATVCNSAGGPMAYVTYFQSQTNREWSAVTVSPAGRIKTWYYSADTGTWTPQ